MKTIERLILSNLVFSSDYVKKVLPFLQSEYFLDKNERIIFEEIKKYVQKYNSLPKKASLLIEINDLHNLKEQERKIINEIVYEIYDNVDNDVDITWLIEQTEQFCKDKAIYLAIMKSISIYDGTEKTLTPHAIPELIKNALNVSFNVHIGLDVFDDAGARYDYYTSSEVKIPFDIDILNDITEGGCSRKTLNVIVAGVNVGKTMSLIHLSSAYMKMGYNVLYITMEMSEYEILRRIDANLLGVSISKIKELGRDTFIDKIQRIKSKTRGKLKVKEFPPGSAHSGHFKLLINELKLKQNFVPDIIVVDYIGITASSRMKQGQQNSYFYLKSVAEELRALAVETETVVWTAMQLTRQGIASTDVEITDVSESMGIPATADFMVSVIRTEELDKVGQLLFKQLKNRYGNKTRNLRFVVGVDLEKQTLYDVNQLEQEKVSNYASEYSEKFEKVRSMDFSGFKV